MNMELVMQGPGSYVERDAEYFYGYYHPYDSCVCAE